MLRGETANELNDFEREPNEISKNEIQWHLGFRRRRRLCEDVISMRANRRMNPTGRATRSSDASDRPFLTSMNAIQRER